MQPILIFIIMALYNTSLLSRILIFLITLCKTSIAFLSLYLQWLARFLYYDSYSEGEISPSIQMSLKPFETLSYLFDVL